MTKPIYFEFRLGMSSNDRRRLTSNSWMLKIQPFSSFVTVLATCLSYSGVSRIANPTYHSEVTRSLPALEDQGLYRIEDDKGGLSTGLRQKARGTIVLRLWPLKKKTLRLVLSRPKGFRLDPILELNTTDPQTTNPWPGRRKPLGSRSIMKMLRNSGFYYAML